MSLYPEMNAKISKLLRMSEDPAQMYAADLIDAYRASGLEPDEIPHWIPVGEQFPEAKDEQYAAFLIPSLFNEKVYCVRTSRYFNESGWTDKAILRAEYYMPLPQPPKGEE